MKNGTTLTLTRTLPINSLIKKSSFISCERIEPESNILALSISKLAGKGAIKLPFDNGIVIDANDALEFSANIVSVPFLLRTYTVEFSGNEQETYHFFTYTRKIRMFELLRFKKIIVFPVEFRKIGKIA